MDKLGRLVWHRSHRNFNRKYLDFEAELKSDTKSKRPRPVEGYCKSGRKPPEIPNRPDKVYKQHWKGFGDWLGTGVIATFNRKYLDFEAAELKSEH